MNNQKFIKHIEQIIEFHINEDSIFIKNTEAIRLLRIFGIRFKKITPFFKIKYTILLFDDTRFVIYKNGVKQMQCMGNRNGNWFTSGKKIYKTEAWNESINKIKLYTIEQFYK